MTLSSGSRLLRLALLRCWLCYNNCSKLCFISVFISLLFANCCFRRIISIRNITNVKIKRDKPINWHIIACTNISAFATEHCIHLFCCGVWRWIQGQTDRQSGINQFISINLYHKQPSRPSYQTSVRPSVCLSVSLFVCLSGYMRFTMHDGDTERTKAWRHASRDFVA